MLVFWYKHGYGFQRSHVIPTVTALCGYPHLKKKKKITWAPPSDIHHWQCYRAIICTHTYLGLGRDVHGPCRGVGREETHEGQLGAGRLAAARGSAHEHVGVSVVQLLEHLRIHVSHKNEERDTTHVSRRTALGTPTRTAHEQDQGKHSSMTAMLAVVQLLGHLHGKHKAKITGGTLTHRYMFAAVQLLVQQQY